MVTEKFEFLGVLANVDESILNVRLTHDLKIEALSQEEGVELIAKAEGQTRRATETLLFMRAPCLNAIERKIYVIKRPFEAEIKENYDWESNPFHPALLVVEEPIDKYLQDTFRLMRLYKNGNICMPLHYVLDEEAKTKMLTLDFRYISHDSYSLADSELNDLDAFLSDTRLPPTSSFLDLAIHNFEAHYETHHLNLKFLSLMMGLETLFNPGVGEVRYRLARNTAVLLGKDEENSRSIYSEIRNLYDKRSNLVHTGDGDIKEQDLDKLRSYVRESIKLILRTNLSKDQMMKVLNEAAFGEFHRRA